MVIFTDLDGTLIDFETYSAKLTAPRVKQLLADKIPVVFCSSKTWGEQHALMRSMGIDTLGIVENGSGIYVPRGMDLFLNHPASKPVESGRLIAFGQPAAQIRASIETVSAALQLDLRPYSALTDSQIVELTGLSADGAARARARDFSETLTAKLQPDQWVRVQNEFAQHNLQCLCGGRFYTVSAQGCNKGTALAATVKAVSAARSAAITSVAIGDSFNDVDMLRAADLPYLVQQPGGTWHPVELLGLNKISAIGPAGWLLAIDHATAAIAAKSS
jgi:mannosyl-3-phosphoglycerate phosphatase